MTTCHQPRPDASGRLVYHGGQVVRCGKPAGWVCTTCDDQLCCECARSFGHMPRPLPGEAAYLTNTDATKGSVLGVWPARVQSGSSVRWGGVDGLSRSRTAVRAASATARRAGRT